MHLQMYDFMTFVGQVVVKPHPRLNLVIGPNGKGPLGALRVFHL